MKNFAARIRRLERAAPLFARSRMPGEASVGMKMGAWREPWQNWGGRVAVVEAVSVPRARARS